MNRPNYPHVKPLPNEPQWRIAVLYSIAGWMSNWCQREEIATAFGGYFKVIGDGSFIGEIVDLWGKAKIEGTLTGTTLVFEKTYTRHDHFSAASLPIGYSFEKNGNIWKGGFTFHKEEGERRGLAECAISPAINDAFGIVVGPIRR